MNCISNGLISSIVDQSQITKTNGFVERFNGTIRMSFFTGFLEEFYESVDESVDALQRTSMHGSSIATLNVLSWVSKHG
jgi:hypothetical protein